MKFILTMIICSLLSTASFGQKKVESERVQKLRSNLKMVPPSDTKSELKSNVVKTEKVKGEPVKVDLVSIRSSSTNSKYSKTTPVVRMSDVPEKSTITNKINPTLSDVDNLLALTKEREVVHNSKNKSLQGTDDYKVLTNNIIKLKISFNNYIQSNGIQNCSSKEQNFYLASLKQDGKREEYNKNVELIKSLK